LCPKQIIDTKTRSQMNMTIIKLRAVPGKRASGGGTEIN